MQFQPVLDDGQLFLRISIIFPIFETSIYKKNNAWKPKKLLLQKYVSQIVLWVLMQLDPFFNMMSFSAVLYICRLIIMIVRISVILMKRRNDDCFPLILALS